MSTRNASVQVRADILSVEASVAPPELREELWCHIVKDQPRYIECQSKTDRIIPLILLSRVSEDPEKPQS